MTQQFPGDQTGTSKPPPSECPRCGSTNTKFCYYNNYNKSQPRHFCKSCKRHWTKGGTLRNIPAGRHRRNKRPRASASASAAAPEPQQKHLLNSNHQNDMSDILYQALIRSSPPVSQGTILESNGTTCAAGLKVSATQNYTNTEEFMLSSFTSVPTYAENVDSTEEISAAAPWAAVNPAELGGWNEIDCLASLWDRSDAEMLTPYKPIFEGYYPR